MRKMTQQEFDSLPEVDGIRQCPGKTDYSAISSFSGPCSFGEYCIFGEACSFSGYCRFSRSCSFGESCRFGNYCSFGESCRFGNYCSFGEYCSFSRACSFGRSCSFGEHCKLEEDKQIIGPSIYQAGGFGSCNRTTYGIPTLDGVFIRCGCWSGWLEAFRDRVKEEYGDTDIAVEYGLMADLFEARWNRQKKA